MVQDKYKELKTHNKSELFKAKKHFINNLILTAVNKPKQW